jgi:gliding motility-associated-like protein
MKKWIFVAMQICVCSLMSKAQITFQKLYNQTDSASSILCFDSKATPDGGYVMTGLVSEGASTINYHPFIIKVNCKGQEVWSKNFGLTQSTANIGAKIIVTQDSGFVMINNLGVYTNYNGWIVRLDKNGNLIWQKLLNLSVGNDVVTDIKETSDGHFILSANVKNTPDIGLVKLDSLGNLIWCKTFGNIGLSDESSSLIETQDGNYLITGKYFSMGYANAFLLKTDTSGTLQWLKCYGDTLQACNGFALKELGNGDILLGGSTTLLKPSFSSFGDNFLLKLNSLGDTLWSRIFYGNPDQFEHITSIEIDYQGNYLLCTATASYPSVGFVPNKMGIAKYSPTGNFLTFNLYNSGSSQYPRLSKTPDNTFIISGFTTQYAQPIGFRALLIKMDKILQSGCFEQDVFNTTVSTSFPFKITQPIAIIGNSGLINSVSGNYSNEYIDSTLCESYPSFVANFTQNSFCVGDTIQFIADTMGILNWHWDFGITTTQSDTAVVSNPTFIFTQAGNYAIQLIFSNGCQTDTLLRLVQIKNCFPTSLPVENGLTHNVPFELPNAFSPNGDNLNDMLKPIIKSNAVKIEFLSMDVYNRWGGLIYASKNPMDGWNGFGQNMNTYVVMIRYKINEKIFISKSDVMLFR